MRIGSPAHFDCPTSSHSSHSSLSSPQASTSSLQSIFIFLHLFFALFFCVFAPRLCFVFVFCVLFFVGRQTQVSTREAKRCARCTCAFAQAGTRCFCVSHVTQPRQTTKPQNKNDMPNSRSATANRTPNSQKTANKGATALCLQNRSEKNKQFRQTANSRQAQQRCRHLAIASPHQPPPPER